MPDFFVLLFSDPILFVAGVIIVITGGILIWAGNLLHNRKNDYQDSSMPGDMEPFEPEPADVLDVDRGVDLPVLLEMGLLIVRAAGYARSDHGGDHRIHRDIGLLAVGQVEPGRVAAIQANPGA